MTGDNMAATFLLPNMELVEGRETRISQVRPITDATSGITFAVTSRRRLGDTGTTRSFSTMQDSGDIDCRISGRYLRARVTVDAGEDWSYIQGIDVPFEAAGGRR
jgi:hypothetical protein